MPSLVEDNLEGAWKESEKIKEDGLARNIDLQAVMKTVEIRLSVNQIEFHPYDDAQSKSLLEYSENMAFSTKATEASRQAQSRNGSRSILPTPIFRHLTKDELATIDVPFGLSLSRNTLRCMAAFAGAYAMYTFVKSATGNLVKLIALLPRRRLRSLAAFAAAYTVTLQDQPGSAMITKRKSASEPSDTDDHMLACRHDASRSPINLNHAVS
ncbi:hypothetical protein FPV67DRAFT_1456105 [Lyophyllum atratum]|nr:hypothetical protein FPV67DRAFT_1456105 [Lyophyllum atratum]